MDICCPFSIQTNNWCPLGVYFGDDPDICYLFGDMPDTSPQFGLCLYVQQLLWNAQSR